jgi:hypothetical protein
VGGAKGQRCSCHAVNALFCELHAYKESTYVNTLNSEGKIINRVRMSNEKLVSVMASEIFDRVALTMNLEKGKQLFGDYEKKR